MHGQIQDVPISKYDPMNFLNILAKCHACIINSTIATPSCSTIVQKKEDKNSVKRRSKHNNQNSKATNTPILSIMIILSWL